MTTHLGSPYEFRKDRIAPNRLVVPPMASQTASTEGLVTDKTLAHYERLASARPGIFLVEYTSVHRSGRSEPNQLAVDGDHTVPGLTRLNQTLKAAGVGLTGLQITHGGGKSDRDLTGGALMGPSAIAVPVRGDALEAPTPMGFEQIQDWINWFRAAAGRAEQAGFDFVELHAGHGYGLNQWLSPITNQRRDAYGGSVSGRARLLRQIGNEIRLHHPDLLLAVRFPGQDNAAGGMTREESKQTLGLLDVDLVDVTSGIGGWRRLDASTGEGYLVDDAAAIRGNGQIPVVGVGGIETAAYINAQLALNRIDFAAMGRKLLADPLSGPMVNH